MKNFKLTLFILFISLFLIACDTDENANDNLEKEEVIEKTENSFEELNSLHQEVDMELISTNNDQEETQNIDMILDLVYDEDKNIVNVHTKTMNTANNQTTELEFYKKDDKAYIKQGDEWTDFNGEESYSTTYEPILDSFLDISEDLEMEENEDEYIFKYEGKDTRIYRIMGLPYNIRYTGIKEKDIELDLEYVISKENMFLDEVTILTLGQIDEQNKIQINVDVDLENFNEEDEIEMPEAIGDTASNK